MTARRFRNHRRPAPAADEAPAEVREPPHDFGAEQSVLGAILSNNAMLETVQGILAPHHFADPLHGQIYEAICKLVDRGQQASPISLRAFMETHGQAAGGPAYLAGLLTSSWQVQSPKQYAVLVRRLWQRRQTIETAQRIAAIGWDDDGMAEIDERLREATGELDSIGQEAEEAGGLQPLSRTLAGALANAESAFKRDGGLAGLATGIARLDQIVGGLNGGDLVILAGRPGMGKSALALNIAVNVAKAWRGEADELGRMRTVDGGRAIVFSLEMAADQLTQRLMADQAALSASRLRRGEISAAEFDRLIEATVVLERAPLTIDDTAGQSLARINSRARRWKRQHGLDLIVIDYLQLIEGSRWRDGRTVEVGEISRGLKKLAKDLGVPVIALSQLSRAVEGRADKRPMLSDLRESGSIEQDADIVAFIYRPDYYASAEEQAEAHPLERTRDIGRAEVIIAKHRHGPTGTAELRFNAAQMRFTDP